MDIFLFVHQFNFAGHPVDVFDNRYYSCLHEAAEENHPECLKILLQQGNKLCEEQSDKWCTT